jgi:hypothetical protein
MSDSRVPAPLPHARITIAVLWLAAAGIAAYWISFFSGGEVHASSDPCYLAFERNFPLPDGFVGLCAVLCAEGLRRRAAWALLYGLLAAGGFFFLGFIDVAYNLWNDMYRSIDAPMAAEIAINAFSLGFAAWLSAFLWRERRALGV